MNIQHVMLMSHIYLLNYEYNFNAEWLIRPYKIGESRRDRERKVENLREFYLSSYFFYFVYKNLTG